VGVSTGAAAAVAADTDEEKWVLPSLILCLREGAFFVVLGDSLLLAAATGGLVVASTFFFPSKASDRIKRDCNISIAAASRTAGFTAFFGDTDTLLALRLAASSACLLAACAFARLVATFHSLGGAKRAINFLPDLSLQPGTRHLTLTEHIGFESSLALDDGESLLFLKGLTSFFSTLGKAGVVVCDAPRERAETPSRFTETNTPSISRLLIGKQDLKSGLFIVFLA
jgi:hypothetical protein